MRLDETVRSWTARAGIVRVRNALNPLLWTMAAITPTSFVAAHVFRDDSFLKYGFSVLGASPVVVTLASYLYFMFRDPDRLQSEEYVLRQHAMQILYEKDATAEIVDIVNEAPRLEVEPRQGKDEQ
jgi:hypothetical protein